MQMQVHAVAERRARRPAAPAPRRGTAGRKHQAPGRRSQRRVVGAARRGEALAAIAAREDLAETEVALRLHVGRDQQAAEPETLWLVALVNAAAAGGRT